MIRGLGEKMKRNVGLGIPTEFKLEDWFPMSPMIGPPLPKWMGLTWPWYKGEGPPPEGYTCPYCGSKFDTYAEVVSHIQTEHPGERIPIDIIWT